MTPSTVANMLPREYGCEFPGILVSIQETHVAERIYRNRCFKIPASLTMVRRGAVATGFSGRASTKRSKE
jgi:hypothetical protein